MSLTGGDRIRLGLWTRRLAPSRAPPPPVLRPSATSPAPIAATLSAMGVRVEAPVEADLIRAAHLLELSAQHPGRHPRTGERLTLSLGDALILAVAERLEVKVVTRDRYWSRFADQGHTSAAVVGF